MPELNSSWGFKGCCSSPTGDHGEIMQIALLAAAVPITIANSAPGQHSCVAIVQCYGRQQN